MPFSLNLDSRSASESMTSKWGSRHFSASSCRSGAGASSASTSHWCKLFFQTPMRWSSWQIRCRVPNWWERPTEARRCLSARWTPPCWSWPGWTPSALGSRWSSRTWGWRRCRGVEADFSRHLSSLLKGKAGAWPLTTHRDDQCIVFFCQLILWQLISSISFFTESSSLPAAKRQSGARFIKLRCRNLIIQATELFIQRISSSSLSPTKKYHWKWKNWKMYFYVDCLYATSSHIKWVQLQRK